MSLSTIRDQIKTVIESVTDVVNVHDYQRAVWDEDVFRSLFLDTLTNVNTWIVTRRKTEEEIETDDHLHTRTHEFVIRGYHSLVDEDATEKDFQDLVEDICAAFRGDRTIGGVVFDSRPPQVVIVDVRDFSGVTCHFAEIVLSVDEEFTV